MRVAGTGHRPDKLFGYSQEARDRLHKFAVSTLQPLGAELVISGMALGWDTAIATAAIELGIPLHAYVPFAGQEKRWPAASQKQYQTILGSATDVKIVSPGGYGVWKMQVRNVAMVNDCTLLLALWNGTAGGTGNCVEYAEKIKRPIQNVWPAWVETYREETMPGYKAALKDWLS